MARSRKIDVLCAVITILAVLTTVLFMNGTALGLTAEDAVSYGYEKSIFDDSYVHTINIEMSDWDELIENATAEEYHTADVTIDGETVKNVGIRAKGNTSLSTVSQLDSDRYSFKIEFDCYDSSINYHGLDKLCLNNLIQDYTMMKDYVTYRLMNEFGVASPLVSYCFVTVNGEDWGLYLAVEAVEDSFLERNYGTDYGMLYKPDSMDMGGGRGNGKGFDMKDMDFDKMGMKNPFEESGSEEETERNSASEGEERTENRSEMSGGEESTENRPEMPGGEESTENRPEMSDGEERTESSSGGSGRGPGMDGGHGMKGGPGMEGGPGMGSDDAKLKYIDDEVDSYSTIFDSAKTAVQKSDKKRLIRSIKALNEGIAESDVEKIESALDVDQVIRYMVVHNFVVNGDSYTGSMIHNYYLYEEDGRMAMIPWDYNLAFGTFQAGEATESVNDPIDTPLSVTEDSNDRPMFSWITSAGDFTEVYHDAFREFLAMVYENGYLKELVTKTGEMLRDYVDRDPTKFCTLEQFDQGVETMREFVTLRCESISGQLDGTIPSTDAGQEADASHLTDASALTLSDMGSMGGGRGGGPGRGGSDRESGGGFTPPEGSDGGSGGGFTPPEGSDRESGGGFTPPEGSDGESGGGFTPPEGFDGQARGGAPGGMGGPGDMAASVSAITTEDYIYTGVSAAAILLAICFALCFRRKRLTGRIRHGG